MVKRQITMLVDDITGEEIADGEGESITFALNGVEYSIDLNAKNAQKFHDTMAFYIDHGSRTGARKRSAKGAAGAEADRLYDPKAVRQWAGTNGVDVPPRGRIPAKVLAQYRAAES